MSNAGSEADDELPATRDSPRDVGRMDEDVPSTSTVSNYTTQLASRASLTASFRPSEAPRTFSLESVLTLPHATSVYALSLPAFGHHLFTGGSDGFIRRYNLHDSLNGIDSPRNLIMKQAGLSSGVLVGYWENSEAAIDTEEAPGPKFGPRSVSNSTTGGKAGGSPVHSLAVQSQELWGLSGTQSGEIHLFTVRHDEGQIRHTLRAAADAKAGHTSKAAVSVLCLSEDESSIISGGWDGRVIHWDLNTGQALRNYNEREGSTSTAITSHQVSSIAFRPEGAVSSSPVTRSRASTTSPVVTRRRSSRIAIDPAPEPDGDLDAEGSPADFDPLFDRNSTASSPHAADADSASVPEPASFTEAGLPKLSADVLLTSSIDGRVLMWDRRASGKEAVRRLPLDVGTPPWAMQASWSCDGHSVFVGRRNAAIDVYDIRAGSTSSLALPTASGPISAVTPLYGGRHLAVASHDTLRIWDLHTETSAKRPPFRVVSPSYGTTISQMVLDATGQFLATAAGGRGWTTPSASTGAMDGCMVYHVAAGA